MTKCAECPEQEAPMTKPLSEIAGTLESLRAWIRGAGTEYEPTPPPQADADDALRSVLESLDLQAAGANANLLAKNLRLKAEVERLRGENNRIWGDANAMQARIEAVLALHKTRMGGPFCPECGQEVGKGGYCTSPTVKALKGEGA